MIVSRLLLTGSLICLLLFAAGCGVSTPNQSASPGITPAVQSTDETIISAGKVVLFFDDDGSRDGLAALLFLLSDPEISIQAVSVSYGEAHPELYIQHIGRVLDQFGITDIPLGAGQDAPLSGGTPFPDWLRKMSDDFWGIPLPNAEKTYPFQDAPHLMVSIIKHSSEPVTIFLSGPFTNLAQALRLDPTIREDISAVYFMGGAVYVPGNITNLIPESSNLVAEWNILADPQAAKEVFEAGLVLYMIPLDATNQVLLRQEDISPWHEGDEKADMAAALYDFMLDGYVFESIEIFDLTAAVLLVRPELCVFEPFHLDVVTDEASNSGQTFVVPNEAPNVHVCLSPDVSLIKQTLNEIFSNDQ